tara:strand:- start:85 stop:552 length:468 start_codon:yes stop_codon:yes gene_type:complete
MGNKPKDENMEYHGTCYCGTVEVVVTGPPTASGFCHCHSCRKWHSAPINAFSIWPKDKVEITGDLIVSNKDPVSERMTCSKCGGCLANGKPTLNMVAVYSQTLADSGFKYVPDFHIFYDERVIDIADGLPKFNDLPETFGGSGNQVNEPEHSGWV